MPLQTDTITNIDPYAVVSLGSAEFQTSVASGTSPTWKDESKEFPVEVPDSQELQILLKVGDEHYAAQHKHSFRYGKLDVPFNVRILRLHLINSVVLRTEKVYDNLNQFPINSLYLSRTGTGDPRTTSLGLPAWT